MGLPHFAKVDVVNDLPPDLETGVYYGFASVDKGDVHKMVMSIGWNPFYKNSTKSMETHVLHTFDADFYGKELRVVILGYLRPEKNFGSLEELIAAIKNDIENASNSLDGAQFAQFKKHSFFSE
ncbi:hypothetical protein JTB14_034150 [Gonioctena quinquepunctata]|nr:hypothetical protein JTB14_034150 [Gonioctena quinquepunctata]